MYVILIYMSALFLQFFSNFSPIFPDAKLRGELAAVAHPELHRDSRDGVLPADLRGGHPKNTSEHPVQLGSTWFKKRQKAEFIFHLFCMIFQPVLIFC